MFDFGDEFVIKSHKIPWLIWIQILIIFLLIILLYFFSISILDLTLNSSSSSSTSAFSDEQYLKKRKNTTVFISTPTQSLQHNQVRCNQSIKGELATNSRRVTRGEDIKEKEVSSPSKLNEPTRISYHPCDYVRLAKNAFLKCLGLDLLFEDYSPSNTEQ